MWSEEISIHVNHAELETLSCFTVLVYVQNRAMDPNIRLSGTQFLLDILFRKSPFSSEAEE